MSATTTTASESMSASRSAGWRFDYLLISLFGSVMGLTGLSVAWRLAHVRYGAPERAAAGIGVAAI